MCKMRFKKNKLKTDMQRDKNFFKKIAHVEIQTNLKETQRLKQYLSKQINMLIDYKEM